MWVDYHLDPLTVLALSSDDAPPIAGDILEASILRAGRYARRRRQQEDRAKQDAVLNQLRREMGML